MVEKLKEFGVKAFDNGGDDGVIVAVVHDAFRRMEVEDVREMFDGEKRKKRFYYWRL
jgi:hypothetical protein